ncbi:unnamed protein product [Rotaria sp. Silwood2]|nr:unnamed protein product [Rotaria sp. Silwood2]CAF2998032.1 unnamed protein product [Rotaria sp. Silwood2]CAF3378085.1 unnamed protein product [Rotaria sp. Silwood2]
MKLQIANMFMSPIHIDIHSFSSPTVVPVDSNIVLFQDLFDMFNIQLDDLDISNCNAQERVNNALCQFQRRSPRSTLSLFEAKLSIQESRLTGPC